MKPRYEEKRKLCHIDTESFVNYIKTGGIYSDIANFVERKLGNLNNGLVGTLSKGKNEKVIVLMKDGLCQKIMREFAVVRTKSCSH